MGQTSVRVLRRPGPVCLASRAENFIERRNGVLPGWIVWRFVVVLVRLPQVFVGGGELVFSLVVENTAICRATPQP